MLVESLTGNTWKAAELIGTNLAQEGWTITGLVEGRSTRSTRRSRTADIVLVGTWTHGLFVVGQTPWALGDDLQPAGDARQAGGGVPARSRSTPARASTRLTGAVAATGADVIGGLEIKRNFLDQHTEEFVESPDRRRRVGLTRRAGRERRVSWVVAAAAFVTAGTRWLGSTS